MKKTEANKSDKTAKLPRRMEIGFHPSFYAIKKSSHLFGTYNTTRTYPFENIAFTAPFLNPAP